MRSPRRIFSDSRAAKKWAATSSKNAAQVLKKIDGYLAQAGTDKSKLLSATVYVADMSQKPMMNEAWQAWLSPGNHPTRACVCTGLGSPETLVEIVVTAAK